MQSNNQWFNWALIVVFIFIGILDLVLLSFLLNEQTAIYNQRAQVASFFEQEKKQVPSITIFAVGDIMLDRGVEFKIQKQGEGDFRFPFLRIAEYLKKADILFANLEGTISDRGERVGSIYSFRMAPAAVEGLQYAGFDILSLANNHMFDYQRVALEDTMHILRANSIDYVGAGFDDNEAFSVKVKTTKAGKIGFLAFTDVGPGVWRARQGIPGIAWVSQNDVEDIKQIVKDSKKQVDVLIVSLHSGIEYSPRPSAFQEKFSKACISAGADLVLGHHSHVVQPVEPYKDGWIAYSLGNFVFDQSFSQQTMQGLLLEIIIEQGAIREVNPKEIKISKSFQPHL